MGAHDIGSRLTRLVTWSSPLLLIVIILTSTARPAHPAARAATTSEVSTAHRGVNSSILIVRTGVHAVAARDWHIVATGALTLGQPIALTPNITGGNWRVLAPAPIALAVSCGGPSATVGSDFQIASGLTCTLLLRVQAVAPVDWRLEHAS